MRNVSLASLVNKSQMMSRAFYKMQGNLLSVVFFYYSVFLGNKDGFYTRVDTFLSHAVD